MRAFEQRKKNNPDSSSFFGPKIQKKLKTGTVGDQFEVEADHVADKVVNNTPAGGALLQSKEEVQQKPISETISSVQAKDMKEEEVVQKKSDKEEEKPVQAKCKDCEKEEKKLQKKGEKEEDKPIQAKCEACEKEEKIQKKEKNTASETQNNDLERKLDTSKGSGAGLDKKTKGEMETGFGADFSNVKIHTDSRAVQMSQELGAQAFTNGNDVYFNKGKYNPASKEGKHLLAHELTHTIQQTGMVQKSRLGDHPEDLQNPKDPDFKGNQPLERANDNETLITKGQQGSHIKELQKGLIELDENALPNFGADSDFGKETKEAVIEFQNGEKLNKIDGIVGPETMGALDNAVVEKKGGKKDKKDKKDKKPCKRTKPVVVKGDTFHSQMVTKFFAENGCKNEIIIKSRDMHDNSGIGGCNSFVVVVDGINRGTVNPSFKKDTVTKIKIPDISIGEHQITLTIPGECNALIKATISVF